MIDNDLDHEKIRLEMQAMKASYEAGLYMIELALKEIKQDLSETLDNTKKTNGRVTQLELDYEIVRILRKNKWLVLIITIGIFKIYELIDLNWVYNKIITHF